MTHYRDNANLCLQTFRMTNIKQIFADMGKHQTKYWQYQTNIYKDKMVVYYSHLCLLKPIGLTDIGKYQANIGNYQTNIGINIQILTRTKGIYIIF